MDRARRERDNKKLGASSLRFRSAQVCILGTEALIFIIYDDGDQQFQYCSSPLQTLKTPKVKKTDAVLRKSVPDYHKVTMYDQRL